MGDCNKNDMTNFWMICYVKLFFKKIFTACFLVIHFFSRRAGDWASQASNGVYYSVYRNRHYVKKFQSYIGRPSSKFAA